MLQIYTRIHMSNPFIFKGYIDSEHFCDRQKELETMINCVKNNIDVTLIAQRRMGKTGLIYRLMDEIKSQQIDITLLYVDIFATRNLAELNKTLADTILQTFPEKTSLGKRFLSFIKGFRPTFGFDQITGLPEITFYYQNEADKVHTLESQLAFLEEQPVPVLLAIDEFQQIREYPEQNIEAILRTILQQSHNITCIFCGSRKHMMVDIFSNPQRPFFSSTQFIGLANIDATVYTDYIVDWFHHAGRTITDDAVQMILRWTRLHTYYTQRLCHEVFSIANTNATTDDVKRACLNILSGNESYFLQYRSLLSDGQWRFLIALSKEEEVEKPYATLFLKKYNIGASAVAHRNLESLQEKDLVFCETTKERTYYAIADVFFMRWLAREY